MKLIKKLFNQNDVLTEIPSVFIASRPVIISRVSTDIGFAKSRGGENDR